MDSRKAVLTCGLGRYAASDANAVANFGPDTATKTKEMLAASIAKAQEAGFDMFTIDANPADPEDTLSRLSEMLRSRKFVAVNVGFGLRGNKEHTELFERLLNAAIAIQPEIKIIFSNAPDQVITAIQRNFPEAFATA